MKNTVLFLSTFIFVLTSFSQQNILQAPKPPMGWNSWNWFGKQAINEENNKWATYAGNGYWNDPDMLATGEQGLTIDEQKVHFALWCIMSSPLMLGNDPRVMTTEEKDIILNELALPIILESGWVVMADKPEAYLNSPAKHMLQQMKAAWDESVLIDGYPGEFICLTRRNDKDWYLAALMLLKKEKLKFHWTF